MASLVIGVAATAVTYVVDLAPTLKDGLTITVSGWVISMVFCIAYSLQALHAESQTVKIMREAVDAGDDLLLELQSRLREIASRPLNGRPNRVFIDYCHRSLTEALYVARTAAQTGELTVRDHHFDTVDQVMAAFEGCNDRTFRCVWLIDNGELFDESWRKYMECLVALAKKPRSGSTN